MSFNFLSVCLDVVVLTFHVGIGRCVSWVEIKVKQVLVGWPGSMHTQSSSCLNFVDVKFFRTDRRDVLIN